MDTSPRGSGRWKLVVPVVVVIVPLLGFAAWTWITLHVGYSNGERAGYIQKISRKGWVCKTWEGELAMVSMPGTAPQIFYFTVPSVARAECKQHDLDFAVFMHRTVYPSIPGEFLSPLP